MRGTVSERVDAKWMSPPRTSSATVSSGAQIVGPPQLRYRGEQAPPSIAGGEMIALVELAQDAEHPSQLVDRRAPPRLGGVGGHDQPQLGRGEHLPEIVGTRPGAMQGGDRLAEGARPRDMRIGGVAGPEPADPLVVLGQVDEL